MTDASAGRSGEHPRPGNLGPRQVLKRRAYGVVGAAAAVLLFIALEASDVHRAWRILLFPPVLFATLGFLQAHGAT